MKHYTETKIGRIIEDELDSRLEIAIFMCLLENGIDKLKKITEEDWKSEETRYSKLMKKCVSRIAKEATNIEIMEYIRCHLHMTPAMETIHLYRDYFNDFGWDEIKYQCDADAEVIEICGIVNPD